MQRSVVRTYFSSQEKPPHTFTFMHVDVIMCFLYKVLVDEFYFSLAGGPGLFLNKVSKKVKKSLHCSLLAFMCMLQPIQ